MHVTGRQCGTDRFWKGGCGRAPADRLLVLDGVLEQHAHQQAPLAEAGVPPHLHSRNIGGCASTRQLHNALDHACPLAVARGGRVGAHLGSCSCPPDLLLHLQGGIAGNGGLECHASLQVQAPPRVSCRTLNTCACLLGTVRGQHCQKLHVSWVVARDLPLLRLVGGS